MMVLDGEDVDRFRNEITWKMRPIPQRNYMEDEADSATILQGRN
jgi:hypothetical protein